MLNTITFILVLFGQVSADIPAPPEDIPAPPEIDEAFPDSVAAPAEPAVPDEVPETPTLDDSVTTPVADAPDLASPDDVSVLEPTPEIETVQENAAPETQPQKLYYKKRRIIPPPQLPPPPSEVTADVSDPLLVNPSTLDATTSNPYEATDYNSSYDLPDANNDRALQNPTPYDNVDDSDLYDAQLEPNQGKGHIMPIDQAEVPAQEQGVLTKFFIREGFEVKKDDPLAQIDDEQAKMSVQVQQAKLNAAEREASNDVNIRYAKAAKNVAEAELKSAKETIARVPGAVPATEIRKLELSVVQATLQIEQSTNQFEISKYQVDVSKAELDAAKLGVTRRVVKSPISGIIVEKYRNEGEWVKPGDPIVKVVYFEKLRVKTTFDINRIPLQRVLKHNAKITVVQKPGMTFNGRVVFANPVVQSGGAYEVWIDVDNVVEKDGFWALQPGMNAIVTIE
ncbi:MAG: efflux RND transporter periplasmic adaptor subunit [Thermoguttaceae bacterium]|nr:efflux RND transporter periplasmic adaptor subunit [Thermoguttaceae bacterium]